MTIPLQTGIVYGPIASRRLGRSLGINILPEGTKVCNFNCPYCQYGWTPRLEDGRRADWPSPDVVARAADAALAVDPAVDRITLAGNGEPTLHPEFAEIVQRLRAVRDRRARDARLAILSNSATLDRPFVAAALDLCDERYMKLDAGDDGVLRRMNGSPVPIADIVGHLSTLRSVVLQAMFTRDRRRRIDNTSPAALNAWLEAVTRVRPTAVHIYTIDRDPAWKDLERVPHEELEAIAARVRAAGIRADTFS